VIFEAAPVISVSTIVTWATISAADQAPSRGGVRQCFSGTWRTADSNFALVRRSFSSRGPRSGIGGLQLRSAGLFERMSDLQHAIFGIGRAVDLQSDGQAFLGFATGDRDSGHAREGSGNSINISEIHL